MKYLIIILYLLFINVYVQADGGSINNARFTLNNLENKQIKVLNNLKSIKKFMGKYTNFFGGYKKEMVSILKDGANCITLKHEYIYSKRNYGENNINTRSQYKFYQDCLKMQKIRYSTMETLNKKFDVLKGKVDALEERKNLTTREANMIRDNVKNIKRTLGFVMENN